MTDIVVPFTGWGSLSQAWNEQSWGADLDTAKTVTVVSTGSGNKYAIDGTQQATLYLARGATYVFDVSDSSVSGHPLQFSTTSDGTHGGGSAYTSGVTVSGSAGSGGATVTFVVPFDAPDTLYYYCSNHSGMGGTANIFTSSIIPIATGATTAVAAAGGTAVTITGIPSTGGVGSVQILGADTSFVVSTADLTMTGLVNGVTVIGDANIVNVTSAGAVGVVGVGFVWGLNVPDQDPNWQEIAA